MDIELIVYAKYDEHGSIVEINSNIFLDDLTEWKEIDHWEERERWRDGDRYLYSHAGNGEYVLKKYGKPLYDEHGKPNFHDDFIEWTDEEKEQHYPTPIPKLTFYEEQNDINIDVDFRLSMLELGI